MHKDCTQAVRDLIESKVEIGGDESGAEEVDTEKKKNKKKQKLTNVIVNDAKISGTESIFCVGV